MQKVAHYLGVTQESTARLRRGTRIVPLDKSHPAYDRDHNKCILCGRCVQACQDIAAAGAIDLAYRGYITKVSTCGDQPILDSICQACGECLSRCPTGALRPKYYEEPSGYVKTICPIAGSVVPFAWAFATIASLMSKV